jgi:hypothetical protein
MNYYYLYLVVVATILIGINYEVYTLSLFLFYLVFFGLTKQWFKLAIYLFIYNIFIFDSGLFRNIHIYLLFMCLFIDKFLVRVGYNFYSTYLYKGGSTNNSHLGPFVGSPYQLMFDL